MFLLKSNFSDQLRITIYIRTGSPIPLIWGDIRSSPIIPIRADIRTGSYIFSLDKIYYYKIFCIINNIEAVQQLNSDNHLY